MTLQLHTGTSAAAFKMTGGIYTLTTLELHSTNPAQISQQLETMVEKAPILFQQTPVIIAFDQLSPEQPPIDLYPLRHTLQQFGLIFIAIRGGQESHKQAAMMAGIPWLPAPRQRSGAEASLDGCETNVVIMQKTRAATSTDIAEPVQTFQKATLVEHPIRSGQQVYAEGDLIVTGPVSAGAELLAGGNIHVYGPLRGRALAGVNGDGEARIFCLQFAAELISINGQYRTLTGTGEDEHLWGESVIITLDQQSLHIRKL